jgi:signal transduction histidine kinase
VLATHSPNAEPGASLDAEPSLTPNAEPDPAASEGSVAPARADRFPRPLRRLLPRTFQGRLTVGFVTVVALTLALVGPAVILRLDDYFLQQEQDNIQVRAGSTLTIVALLVNQAADGAVVTPDNRLTEAARAFLTSDTIQEVADNVAQADMAIRVGTATVAPAGDKSLIPSPTGSFTVRLAAVPEPRQARESISSNPVLLAADRALTPWAIEITLSNPYTVRASTLAAVTGLFLVVGAIAFIVSVAVAAFLARRFTTPLRRLTTAAKDLELGELGSRVPTRLAATGATEISELSRQFNAMADRLEESVAIIRRDRDRSRDFLADVSHELRTPIAALRTFNELLSEGADDDPDTRAEFLESSRQQLERLDWLAQNLLDLSKLDSGLVLPDFRPDDLRAAVESAVEQAETTARKRGVELVLALPPRPIRIRHDPQRIGQVVSNLVGNALKFTSRGGSVAVALRPIPNGAQIEVHDTGVGIDPSEMPRIFERFYRGSLANEARGSGSGLGLAIVKSIVDLHAGRITVESRLGAGTTFVVTLPRDPRKAEIGEVADSSPSGQS